MQTEEKNACRVVTPLARLSYPYLFKLPKPINDGDEPKYGCELIFEKGADLSELKRAAAKAARDKWGDKLPKGLRSPFRDGDEREGKAGYEEGTVFIGARSKDQPGVVVGKDRREAREKEVYGGCFVKASVTAFAYETKGNKGVSFALNNVWVIRDGEPFSNRRTAEEEFENVEIDEDAFGEYADAEDSGFASDFDDADTPF